MSDTDDSSSSELGDGITLDDLQKFVGGQGADDSDTDDDDFVPASPLSEDGKKSAPLNLPARSPSKKAAKRGKDRLSPGKVSVSKSPKYSPMKKKVKVSLLPQKGAWTCKAAFDSSATWKPLGKTFTVETIPDVPASSGAFCEYCSSSEATVEDALKRIVILRKAGKEPTVVWGFLGEPDAKQVEMITNQPTVKRVGAMIAFIETKKQKWGSAAAKFWSSWEDRTKDLTGFPIPALLASEIKKATSKLGSEKKEEEADPPTINFKPVNKRKAASNEVDDSLDECRALKRPAALQKPESAAAKAAASAAEETVEGSKSAITFAQFAAFAACHNISAIHFK